MRTQRVDTPVNNRPAANGDGGGEALNAMVRGVDSALRYLRNIRRRPITTQIAIGSGTGLVTGYTFSKTSKVVAVSVGCTIIALQFCNYRGYLKLNRTQLQRDLDDLKDIVRDELGIERRTVPSAREAIVWQFMFTVHFTVSVSESFTVGKDEWIFVVGSHETLGNWDPKKALKLNRDEKDQFVGTISLYGIAELKFRYFIGYYLQSELGREPALIVYKWETHRAPRSLLPAVEASKTRVCRSNLSDIFGFCGGRTAVSDGWIANPDENEIHLTIAGTPLKFYKSGHVEDDYRFRITPLDLRNKHDGPLGADDEVDDDTADATLPPLPSHSATEIATLSGVDPRFRAQNDCGEPFHNEADYFVFRTRSVAVEYLGFRIEVFSPTKNRVIAVGYALPSTLHDNGGRASAPLLSPKGGLPVGKCYFRYLFVRALLSLPADQRMDVSYARQWKKRTTLEVGHRGMGNSYTKCAVARENTLHSLNSAANRGADLVEFDVHLTRDKVPVVYHDFHVMVSVAKRSSSVNADPASDSGALSDGAGVGGNGSADGRKNDFYQLAVKDLKLNQLKLLHLDHVSHANSNEKISEHKVTGEYDEAIEHHPFPTLVEAFENVSTEVGFNVEIKYPLRHIDGQSECDNYFERNEFLDIILADVLKHAGVRRIVFSSFDPDVCAMLSLKQNKYPVLFLCCGDTKRHVPYEDERTRTSITAVKFARGMELMGVNFNSEDLLRDPTPVQMARDFGLISFVWGDELIDKKNVDYFKKTLFVDGVIYDRIGEGEERSNVFSLEKKMKAALFSSKRVPQPITSPRSSSITQLQHSAQPVSGDLSAGGHSTATGVSRNCCCADCCATPKINGNGGAQSSNDHNHNGRSDRRHHHSHQHADAHSNKPKEWPEHKDSSRHYQNFATTAGACQDGAERKMRRINSTTHCMDIASTTALSAAPSAASVDEGASHASIYMTAGGGCSLSSTLAYGAGPMPTAAISNDDASSTK